MESSTVVPSFGLIPHLFPVRDGVLATLVLPADLTVAEARRLTAFVESLALPDAPSRPVVAPEPDATGSAAMPEPRRPPVGTPTVLGA